MSLSRTTSWTDVVTCTTAARGCRLLSVVAYANRLATASVFLQLWSASTGVTPGTTAADLVVPIRPAVSGGQTRIEPTKVDAGGLIFGALVYTVTVTSTGGTNPTGSFAPEAVQVDWTDG